MEIKIEKVAKSRLETVDLSQLVFGKYFSDHMFMMDFENEEWKNPRIVPFDNICFKPSLTALHYGQSIFEGMKAYKNQQGEPKIFRPKEHLERLNKSAVRMAMPEFPEAMFLEALSALMQLDKDWIPTINIDDSLYIRPVMFATDTTLGLHPSEKFCFIIFCSPASSYYSQPLKVLMSNEYVRAFPGGVGSAKAAGNYAATMLPLKQARAQGYDQLLWMDGVEFKSTQEIGTMNVFFVIDDRVITPLLDGTILDGITRRSVIELLKDKGYFVQERRTGIGELMNAYKNGKLEDAFGTGTAASLAHIAEMKYGEQIISLPDISTRKLSTSIKTELAEIKRGLRPDTKGWMY